MMGRGLASTHWTIYDGLNPYADFDGQGNVTYRYLYGPAVDVIMARRGAEGDLAWYLGDHLGTVRDLADTSGQVIDHIAYDSFGGILSETNPAVGDRFKFTAREFDAAIEQYYYRARYYDARIGRFTSEDPFGLAAGDANVFRYVLNRPTVATDPTGLRPPRTEDERRLVELCDGDPELIRKVELLLDVLDKIWVFPFWIDRCVAWCDAFLEKYNALPPRDRFYVHYETPLYIGFPPTWREHAVLVIKIKGVEIYLDKRLQGGSDHIAFERHPDLIYPDDDRYEPEARRRAEEARQEQERRRHLVEELERRPELWPPRSAGFPYEGPLYPRY